MNDKKLWLVRTRSFVLGMVALLVLLMLTGMVESNHQPTLNYGRYQISAWGTQLGKDSGAMGVFVVDTVSGETKTVYTRIYGSPGDGEVVKNDLRKPFSGIR